VNSQAQDKAWIMPGSGLAFSVLVAFLTPLYERSYGTMLPAFTRGFLSAYPLWIALCTAALAITALAEQFRLFARWRALWSGLDMALALVSVLIIAGGLIALFLPLLVSPIAANL